MYRPRLRSHLGCLRCKRRHAKCDEALPKCSFCTRWNQECVRPAKAMHRDQRLPAREYDGVPVPVHENIDGADNRQVVLQRTPAKAVQGLDPFHNFPIAESEHDPVMAPILHQFFAETANKYSHDLNRNYFGLRFAFLANLHDDAAVFFSMLSFCAAFQVTRDTTQTMTRLKLESEKSTLSLLRQRVQGHAIVTDATVLAAIMHVNLVTYDTTDGPYLRRMMNGVNSLARAHSRDGSKLKDITAYMLLLCDVLCSLLNADEPCLQYVEVPARPPSFDLLYQPPVPAQLINKQLSLDVVRLFQDLDFVLFFRTSSEKFHSLSSDESFYMFRLLQSIDVQLTVLQVRHIGDRSLDEIAVLGAILVKLEVVAHSVHQLSTIVQVLKRLQQAILMCPIEAADTFEPLVMWSCFAALVGRSLESNRKWFSDFIMATLFRRLEKDDLTSAWMLDLHLEMRQFPWHERMDIHCTTVCETFLRKHMNNF